MSTHLLIAAAYLEDLPQTTKLVLMAVADSADEHTLEAAPGLPKLRAWSGLGKSQVLAHVARLSDPQGLALLERISPGRIGARAVYRVFPNGVPVIPHPSDVAARYEPTPVSNPVDNPPEEGPAARTLGTREGPISGREGPVATGPLQSYPSVSSGSAPTKAVDKASGFPGARPPADDADGIRRRAHGANNKPCPVADHGTKGEIHGSCGRCAHAAATSDPATVAAARAAARKSIHRPPIEEQTA